MIKKFVVLFIISSIFCLDDSSPCDDFIYSRLKKLDVNSMSNSEYNYFVEMDKKCKSFESKNSSKKEPVTDKDKNSKNNKQSYDFLKKNSTDIDEEPNNKESSKTFVKSDQDLKLINEENQLIKDYILDQRLNFSQHNTYIKDFNPRLYGKTDAEMMFDKSIWQYGGGMLSNVISSSSMLLFISFFAEGLEGPFIPMIFYFGSSFTTSNALSQMAEVKYPANHFFSSYPEDEIRLYKKVYKERTLELRRNAIITGHFQTVVYSFLFGVVLGLALN